MRQLLRLGAALVRHASRAVGRIPPIVFGVAAVIAVIGAVGVNFVVLQNLSPPTAVVHESVLVRPKPAKLGSLAAASTTAAIVTAPAKLPSTVTSTTVPVRPISAELAGSSALGGGNGVGPLATAPSTGTSPSPSVPEVPVLALLPLSSVAVGGAFVLYRRRRLRVLEGSG